PTSHLHPLSLHDALPILSEHLAALAAAKLIDLDALAQDGVRIRASAGAASFRRAATLDRLSATAQAVVEDLKREVAANSDASNEDRKSTRLNSSHDQISY